MEEITRAVFKATVDIGTPVQLAVETGNARLATSLVGIDKNDKLILSQPGTEQMARVNSSVESYFAAGSPFLVRLAANGYVFGFASKVIGVYSTACRLLILSLPEKISVLQLRDDARVPCAFPCVLETLRKKITALVVDVSSGGAFLRTEITDVHESVVKAKEKELPVTLHVKFPHLEEVQALSVKIRAVKKEPDQRIALSITFVELSPAVKHYVELAQTKLVLPP